MTNITPTLLAVLTIATITITSSTKAAPPEDVQKIATCIFEDTCKNLFAKPPHRLGDNRRKMIIFKKDGLKFTMTRISGMGNAWPKKLIVIIQSEKYHHKTSHRQFIDRGLNGEVKSKDQEDYDMSIQAAIDTLFD